MKHTSKDVKIKTANVAWKLLTLLGLGVSCGVLTCCGTAGLELFSLFNSEPITSQSQLESLIEEEKAKLGCDMEITGYLIDESTHERYPLLCSSADITPEGKRYIQLTPFGQDVSTVKHEIYHHCDGHFKETKGLCYPLQPCKHDLSLKYFFVYEPQAAIYEATGLKP